MTQKEVSAVSTRPSTSKHHSSNKQKKSVHADKGKDINCIIGARSMPKIENSVQHGERSVPHATNQIISQQSANLRTSKGSNPVMSVL